MKQPKKPKIKIYDIKKDIDNPNYFRKPFAIALLILMITFLLVDFHQNFKINNLQKENLKLKNLINIKNQAIVSNYRDLLECRYELDFLKHPNASYRMNPNILNNLNFALNQTRIINCTNVIHNSLQERICLGS